MSFPSASEMTSEEQDQELEEYIWTLMQRAGLLSELKSKIAQFVQENGRTKDNGYSANFISSRVNPTILSLIYEYLKWVGMKNTCALLLSESPVPISTKLDADEPPSPLPLLCTYLSGKIAQADKSSMLNETFTKNESNSILLINTTPTTTTPKTQQEAVADSNNKVNGGSPQQQKSPPTTMNQTYVAKGGQQEQDSHRLSAETDSANTSSAEQSNSLKDEDKSEQDSFSYSKQYERELQDKKGNNNKIEEKPLKPSNSDQSLQQKPRDQYFSFMTEKQKMEALNKKFSGSELIPKKKPSTTEDDNTTSKSFSNKMDPVDNGNDKVSTRGKQPAEKILEEQEKATSVEGKVEEAFKESKESENILDISNPLLKKQSDFSDAEFDESISDLIDGKTEDQTLDISIESDSKAMSSCEHIINLK